MRTSPWQHTMTIRVRECVRVGVRVWLGLCVFLLLPPHISQAQERTQPNQGQRELVGVVRDGNGAALEGASVTAGGIITRTNPRGTFQLFTATIDTVTIAIRAVGFTAIEALLTTREGKWDTVLVQLEPSGQRLREVNVRGNVVRRANGLRDFEERRTRGVGLFITREQIAARNSSRISDVIRNERGVNVVRGRVRFVSQGGIRGTVCQPDIWLDGFQAKGLEVDDIPASDIEAMELYASFSSVPFEFTPRNTTTIPCGTIVIWTRVPDGKKR